jgi:hypothetical protein
MATGTTINYSFPYPLPTDPVAVASDIAAVASSLDTFLTNPTFKGNVNLQDGLYYKIDNNAVLSETVLGPSVVSSSLTSVGTITAGTWQAAPIASAYIDSSIARLASPTFTGTPSAPTAAANTNTTQIATTAFVLSQSSSIQPLMNGEVATGTSFKYSREDHVHPVDTSRAPVYLPISSKFSSYTLALVDAGSMVRMSSESDTTISVPNNSSVAFPIGTRIEIFRSGVGEVSVSAESGVTINSENGKLSISSQWQTAILTKYLTNTWLLAGTLSP